MTEESQQPQPELSDFQPTHRHYKGGLYREVGRLTGLGYLAGSQITVRLKDGAGPFEALVTDDIADDTEFVVYMHQDGAFYARPAHLFDGMVEVKDGDDPTLPALLTRRFEPIDEPTAAAPEAADDSNESSIDKMSRAELRDRYRLAQYALGGVPPLPLVQVAANMLIAGGGLQGQLLGKQINVVIGNFLAQEAKKAERKRIILPGGSPAVPHGLGGKGR